MPLLQELQPLLLPPDGDPLQPPGLQRFKAYLQLVAEASEAQLSQSKLEAAQPHSNEPAELINLTASSAVVLQLAVQLCQQVPKDNLSEVTKQDMNNRHLHLRLSGQLSCLCHLSHG